MMFLDADEDGGIKNSCYRFNIVNLGTLSLLKYGLQVESEEEKEEPRVIPSKVKENPFNLVRYGPEEKKDDDKEKEYTEEEVMYDEREDRPAAAPMSGGRHIVG